MNNDMKQRALDYHAQTPAGKTAIEITKPSATADDLTLAYSPGVAEPVRAIRLEPDDAYRYTNKGNLVAVISNGSAVLGLGDMGPLASKPVMEGKAVLFKRFANIDVFDIEVDAHSPQEFIDTVVAIAPSFGGINLEDIKAPECFHIEQELIDRLDIPVFHDDQHGTAIICTAGLLNALEIQNKRLEDIRVVCLGAGAAAISTMRLFVSIGLRKDQITLVDRSGVVHSGRSDLNERKKEFAHDSKLRSLEDAMVDADVFIGLSGGNLLKPATLSTMAAKPIVFAMANPDPEIKPELAKSVRDDLIIATGRSDYPNQVNNVLGFPFIFRGALDVRARHISETMMLAAVHALADLAKEPVHPDVLTAYGKSELAFGPDYIVPTPFDPRLIDRVPPAVAKAAVETGMARTPYPAHYPEID